MEHFSKRVLERYNIKITRREKRQINYSIQGIKKMYEVFFWKRKTNRISVWFVKIKNIWIPCLYDKSRNTVVTCIEIKNKGEKND